MIKEVQKKIRSLLMLLLLLSALPGVIYAGIACPSETAVMSFAAPSGMFMVGESLEYEVSYSLFHLGTVRIEVIDQVPKGSFSVYRAKAYMDSYSGVPFVSLHFVFYSEMAPEAYSVFFSGYDTRDPKNTSFADYVFDYSRHVVTYEKGVKQKPEVSLKGSDTISTTFQDGLSLFFCARANAGMQKKMNVPTFVNEKKVNTFIHFTNKVVPMEIDVVKFPIRTVELDGSADFVGIFGLTGGFQGWFSDDEAAIPIVARMKVILGSVYIELKAWNRPGWYPPRAD